MGIRLYWDLKASSPTNAEKVTEKPTQAKSVSEAVSDAFDMLVLTYVTTLMGSGYLFLLEFITFEAFMVAAGAASLIFIVSAIGITAIQNAANNQTQSSNGMVGNSFDWTAYGCWPPNVGFDPIADKAKAKAETEKLIKDRKTGTLKEQIAERIPEEIATLPPIGLGNAGANCWLNSLLQMILHTSLKDQILAIDLSNEGVVKRLKLENNTLIDSLQKAILKYEKAQKEQNALSGDFSQKVRGAFVYNNPGTKISYNAIKQEDIVEGAEYLYSLLTNLNEKQKVTRTYNAEGLDLPDDKVDGIVKLPKDGADATQQFQSIKTQDAPPLLDLNFPDEPPDEPKDAYPIQALIAQNACVIGGNPGEYKSGDKMISYPLKKASYTYEKLSKQFMIAARRFRNTLVLDKEGNPLLDKDLKVSLKTLAKRKERLLGVEEITVQKTKNRIIAFAVHINDNPSDDSRLSSGHYVSYVQEKGIWYRCSDSSVEALDGFPEEAASNLYLAIYEREKTS